MSNIVVIAGKNHKSISKFFSDRGTMDYISSYESIHENEKTLLMGTYEVDKLLYINQFDDMNVHKDMVALSRIIRSTNSFFTVDEIIIFSLAGDEYSRLFDTARLSIEKEASEVDTLKVPKFNVTIIEKPLTLDMIYTQVLGITKFDKVSVNYRTLYRVERNKKRDDLYDKGNFNASIITPYDFKEIEDYDKLKDLSLRTETGEIITDSPERQKTYLNIDLHHYNYNEFRKSKLIYFVGDRRVGTTTHMLSVAISLHLSGKSVTILDLSDKSDILGILDHHAIPYNSFDIKELISTRFVPSLSQLNVINNFGVSNLDFIKWMQVNPIDTRTDFILIDFPLSHRKYIESISEMVVRIEEMEENTLRSFKSISKRDLVILTNLFEIGRTCEPEFAKSCLQDGVRKIIAPISLKLSDIKVSLAEEILKEG